MFFAQAYYLRKICAIYSTFPYLAILPFLGKLKRSSWDLCYTIYKLHQETILQRVFNRISNHGLLKKKLLFFWKMMITQISIKLHFVKIWRFPEIIRWFFFFFLKIISKYFTGIFSFVRNVIPKMMPYGNLSRLYKMLCSRKVNRSKTTCYMNS